MVSVLAEEHQEASDGSNCLIIMLPQNKERIDRGRDVEKKYSGDRRKYDDSLKVAGEYYEERRSAMQKAGYSDEDIQVRLNQPSPAGYQGEVKETESARRSFWVQDPEIELTLLMRLLRLDKDVIGQTCCDSH